MIGIVHLAGPVFLPPGAVRPIQRCSFCDTVIPLPTSTFDGPEWPLDSLVTVQGEISVRGAQPGSTRCSLRLLEPQEDGA